jgi:septal ring factor EnvC (AmiA/AmiB activator)
MLARAQERMADEMREQRQVNERLNESIADQSVSTAKLATEMKHLSELISAISRDGGAVDMNTKRISVVETKMRDWQRGVAMVSALIVVLFELLVRVAEGLFWR